MMWLDQEVDLSPSLVIRCKMGVSFLPSAHKCSSCISVIIFLLCTSSITWSVKENSAFDRVPCRSVSGTGTLPCEACKEQYWKILRGQWRSCVGLNSLEILVAQPCNMNLDPNTSIKEHDPWVYLHWSQKIP